MANDYNIHLLLDIDGCAAACIEDNQPRLVTPNKLNKLQEYHDALITLFKTSPDPIKNPKAQGRQIKRHLYSGSGRTDVPQDFGSATISKNNQPRHSASLTQILPEMATILGATLHTFLLGDIRFDGTCDPNGTSWNEITNFYEKYMKWDEKSNAWEYNQEAVDAHLETLPKRLTTDVHKIIDLYTKIHYAVSQDPTGHHEIACCDDRGDILFMVFNFYQNHPELIPSDVTLTFYMYKGAGAQITGSSKNNIKPKPIQYWPDPIKGKGEYHPNYAHVAKKLHGYVDPRTNMFKKDDFKKYKTDIISAGLGNAAQHNGHTNSNNNSNSNNQGVSVVKTQLDRYNNSNNKLHKKRKQENPARSVKRVCLNNGNGT